MDLEFYLDFGFMLLQIVFLSLLGVIIGASAGVLILRNSGFSGAALACFRVGLWLPLFTMWAFPIQASPTLGTPLTLLEAGFVTLALLPTTAFAACYHFLNTRFMRSLAWDQARREVTRQTVFHALLVAFFSRQWWTAPYGFHWFFLPNKLGYFMVRYESFLLLVGFLYLLNRFSRFNFDDSARAERATLVRELFPKSRRQPLKTFLIGSVCLVLLWGFYVGIFYAFIALFRTSSPAEALKSAHFLLPSLGNNLRPHLWALLRTDVPGSLLEIAGGMLLAGGVALAVCKAMSASELVRRWIMLVLTLTYLTPLMLHPVFLNLGFRFSSQTVVAVALLTVFPLSLALWALRDHPLGAGILLAIAQALPFAFIGMFWGESMNAILGLGFSIIIARAIGSFSESIALSLFAFVLLFALSTTLRAIARWRYFGWSLRGQVEVAPI